MATGQIISDEDLFGKQNNIVSDEELFGGDPKSALSRSAIIAHNTDSNKYAANRKKMTDQNIPPAFASPADNPVSMDGMLKTLTYKEAWAEYWTRASDSDKEWFQKLPNFTPEIFEEITGIKVGEKSLKGKRVKVELDGVSYTAVIE